MADISKVNGVEVGNISKVDNVETGNVDTLLSGEFPAQQSDPAQTSLTNIDFDSGKATGPSVAYDTTNSVMAFAYGDGDNNHYPSVTCATASGTTLTYGDTVVLESTADCFATGICYNDEQNRFMGAYMVYAGNDYNTMKAFAAGVATSGTGSPKIDSVGAISTIYDPYAEDGGSTSANGNQPEGNMCIYDHSDGASAGRMLVAFNKGGPASGSAVAGSDGDIVACAVTITDVSSNNNVTVGALSVLVDISAGFTGDFLWSWNEQRNKVVTFSTDTSSTYQINARTVTGSGATLTLGTNYPLDTGSANIMSHNNGGENGSSENRFRLDNSKRVVYDDTNNCHHVFIWDDTFDDFHLFNCTVAADNTITWTEENGEPVRSNGIIAQYGNIFTQGASSGWGTSSYNTLGLAFSSGRGRGAVFGNDSTSHSSAESHVAGFVYSPTTGYNFTGDSFQVFENKPKTQVTSPSGHHHISDDGFVGKNLFFVGRNQDSDGESEIMAFDPGVGQRSASGGVFSASNATLSTARSRCNGFGTSRIASIVVGGQNTSGNYLNSGEEYNGNVVVAAGDTLSVTKNQPGSCGSLTAGFVHGGYNAGTGLKTSDEYDGTNFTSGGTSSSIGGDGSRVAGTQTDCLGAGGYITVYRDDVESYNGTSWATEADSPANINYGGMAGTGHEDAYSFAGYPGTASTATYKYNGTSWSTLNSLSNSRFSYQGGGTGEDFLLIGGDRIANNDGEIWNGTSWAASATNALSSHDRYSATPDTDCSGTSALVSFGGGTSTSGSSAQNIIVHHDR
jgi:hypothetical protein